jgi:hypothetical protein
MTFEKGNQAACGNPTSGRPRTYDLTHMANDLIEWASLPSSMTLLDFAVKHRIPAQNLSLWSKKSDVFCEALNIAKAEVGSRRERLVSFGKLDRAAFARTQGMYDKLLNEHERDEKEFEYGLKSKVEDKKERGITINLIEKPWKDGNDRITE